MTDEPASEAASIHSDRRPIATRDRVFAQQIARWLAHRGVSPNTISLLGMVSGLLAGLSLALTRVPSLAAAGFILTALCVQLRLLANLFDGMVAVEQNRCSKLGELFNEVPDRLSDVAILTGAGYSLGGSVVLGFLAAILAVFVAYLRVQGKLAGAAMDYCGPMAKPHRMAAITVASLLVAVLLLLRGDETVVRVITLPGGHAMGVMALTLGVIVLGEVVTALRRLRRITSALSRSTDVSPAVEIGDARED